MPAAPNAGIRLRRCFLDHLGVLCAGALAAHNPRLARLSLNFTAKIPIQVRNAGADTILKCMTGSFSCTDIQATLCFVAAT